MEQSDTNRLVYPKGFIQSYKAFASMKFKRSPVNDADRNRKQPQWGAS